MLLKPFKEDGNRFEECECDADIITREDQIRAYFTEYEPEDLMAGAYGVQPEGCWRRVVSLLRRGLKWAFPRLNLNKPVVVTIAQP